MSFDMTNTHEFGYLEGFKMLFLLDSTGIAVSYKDLLLRMQLEVLAAAKFQITCT